MMPVALHPLAIVVGPCLVTASKTTEGKEVRSAQLSIASETEPDAGRVPAAHGHGHDTTVPLQILRRGPAPHGVDEFRPDRGHEILCPAGSVVAISAAEMSAKNIGHGLPVRGLRSLVGRIQDPSFSMNVLVNQSRVVATLRDLRSSGSTGTASTTSRSRQRIGAISASKPSHRLCPGAAPFPCATARSTMKRGSGAAGFLRGTSGSL
jgi:hypothetical protein